MAITVKHSKVSTIPDGTDTSVVRPSDWNDDHVLTGTIPVANGGTGASTLTGYVKGNGTAAMTASATVPSTDVTGLGTMSTQNSNNIVVTGGSMSGVTISDYVATATKGVANGVASLDGSGTVPISQLPAAVLGALSYQGTWNASTNTPTLTSSVGTKGYYYVVNVAGSTNLNGITDWQVGDWAVYNGSAWQKIDNTDAVTSVNGYTGTVVLTTTDVAEGTNLYYTDARARASVSAGTGISYNSTTGVITNSSPSLGGDVVGPASATDNAIARFDTTTGKLIQNSVVTIGDTGATTGITTLSASTSVTTPIVQATNSAGLALKNASGTTQMSMGAGGGDNMAINVSTNLNGTNAQIDISPTGTGHVHINPSGSGSIEMNPTSAGTMNNMVIGGTTPLAGSFTNLSVTGTTKFDGAEGTAGQVLTSAGTGATPTWTTPTTGTVTSVTGTAPVVSSGGNTPAISMAAANTTTNGYLTSTDWNTFNGKSNTTGTVTSVSATVPSFLSVSGSPITTSGTLAISLSGTALPVLNGGTGVTTSTGTGSVVLSASPTFTGTALFANIDTTTVTAQGFGVRVRQSATSDAKLQFTNNAANTQLAVISHDGSNLTIASSVGNTIVGTLQFADGSTQISNAVPQITVYTSGSGTYTVPTNAKYITVRMVGGGGAGGGSTGTTAGGGGGAGGYLEGIITSLSSTYAYAVGAGGGNTTFGSSLFTANAGSAGTSSSATASGGTGGSASGGSVNATGATGGFGWASVPYFNGGMGAASPFGAGGSGGGTGSGNGFAAVSYGAGGGGAVGGGAAGGGSGGLIIVTAYF